MYGGLIKIEFMGVTAVVNEEARLRQMETFDWLGQHWVQATEDKAEQRYRDVTRWIIALVLRWEGELPEFFRWPDMPKRMSKDCPALDERHECLKDFAGVHSLHKFIKTIKPTMILDPVLEGNSERLSDTETASAKTLTESDGLDSSSGDG